MTKLYREARADYEYLIKHHKNTPYDMTGGFIEGEHFMELMRNPTKSNAAQHYISLIKYSEMWGFEHTENALSSPADMTDKRTREIYEKYT